MNERTVPRPSNPSPLPRLRRWLALLALGLVLGATETPAPATSVRKMDLAQLSKNADKIFRGKVVAVREGSLNAGGGVIPTLTYRIEVSDAVAGQPAQVAEFTAVGAHKKPAGAVQARFPIQMPELKVGKEYLLFVTRPSRVGLSTVVGLGQGAFEIRNQDGKDMAVNEANNMGLGDIGPGPAEYRVLAAKIRSLRAP